MTKITIPPGAELVRMPSIEEADVMAPLHSAIEEIQQRYLRRAEAMMLMPAAERSAALQKLQREYIAECEPITKAAVDAMSRVPMTWLVVKP